MSYATAIQRMNEINQRIGLISGTGGSPATWRNFDKVLVTAQSRFNDGPARIQSQASYDPSYLSTAAGGTAAVKSGRSFHIGAQIQSADEKSRLTPEIEGYMQQSAAAHGLPVALLKAVARAESGFRSDAVSHAGAQGMMQLMPATGRGLGVTDPFDAKQSIEGGARYLANALKKFDGNLRLAVASYNAGTGAVTRYGDVPPYPETQTYVQRVLAYAREYGLEQQP